MDYKAELEKIYAHEVPHFSSELWHKEIIFYGAGSMGKMGYDLLKKAGIAIKYFVDKAAQGTLEGIPIVAPHAVPQEDKEQCLLLIGICTVPYTSIEAFLQPFAFKHVVHFYTFAQKMFAPLHSNGWNCFHPSPEDKEKIEQVCALLAHDEQSLAHYLQFLWWKLRQKECVYAKYPVLSGQKFFAAPCMPPLHKQEILLDVGCHHGQTIEAFLHATKHSYEKIYAIDADVENLAVCQERYTQERVEYMAQAISHKQGTRSFQTQLGYASKLMDTGDKEVACVAIDDLSLTPTIIKLHIEGEELPALEGAVQTIQNTHPLLMVMADHNEDGLYKIPLFIEAVQGYRLFFYLHDYCGNSAVYYAVKASK